MTATDVIASFEAVVRPQVRVAVAAHEVANEVRVGIVRVSHVQDASEFSHGVQCVPNDQGEPQVPERDARRSR
jgi:hypothetical protein